MSKKLSRRGNKRNKKGFIAIPFTGSLPLGVLGDDEALTASLLSAAFGEDIYCISADILVAIRDLTAGEVPIEVGLAHGDLAVAEIVAALGAEVTDPDDIIANELARRPVRRLGMFTDGIKTNMELNDGLPVRQTIKFSVGDAHELNIYAVNRSGAQLTTGCILEFHGTLFGRWQR